MSSSLLDALAAEGAKLLAPLTDSASDPVRLAAVLRLAGAPREWADAAEVAAAVTALAETRDELANAGTGLASFDAIARVLETLDRAIGAARGLASMRGAAYASYGADLLGWLTALYLAAEHSIAYRTAVLLGLVEFEQVTGLSEQGVLVRLPFERARFRFDKVAALLDDPVAAIRADYVPNGLPTAAEADAASDKLFPRVAGLLRALDVPRRYGVPAADRELLGDAAPLVDHGFLVRLPWGWGDPLDAGAVLALSSADRGDLGLVISPYGSFDLTKKLGRWEVEARLTAGIEAIAVGRHGVTWVASEETLAAYGKLRASRLADAEGPAFVFGAPDGTRIEIGEATLAADLALTDARQSFAFTASATSGALVLQSRDGDGLLRALLPPDGVRAAFDLGVTWSRERGLSFVGGIGLDATLPLSIAIGPIVIDAVRLQLTAAPDHVLTELGAVVSTKIGPVEALIDAVGIAAALRFPEGGGNVGLADLDIGFRPPTGLRLGLEIGPVRGSGSLSFEPGRYSGTLSLAISDLFALDLFTLVETRRPDGRDGFSMIASGIASFPGIPVGFGFELCRIGALFGAHRRLDTNALLAALVSGHLAGVLSAPPADASPGALASQVAAILPFSAGTYVGGVVLGFLWGHPTIAEIDLGFLYDTSAPGQITAIGTLSARLPEDHPLVEIHVDLAGVVRFDPFSIDLRARLRDSKLAGMQLTGDAALQLQLGGSPRFLLSLGGFHSGFTPPDDFPALRRLSLSLPSNKYVELSLSGFFAITASSLQFGADLHFWAGIDGVLGVSGDAHFEALLTWRPLHFEASLDVRVSVEVAGKRLFGAALRGALSGPGPWHVEGGVFISVLGHDVEVYSVNASFGSSAQPAPLPAVDLVAALREALVSPRNWRARSPRGLDAISLRTADADRIRVHPVGSLEVTQTVVPLGVTIDRIGAARPSGESKLTLSAANARTVTGYFAPGQFFDLDDTQRLSRPSFEHMDAGLQIDPPVLADPTPFLIPAGMGYETIGAVVAEDAENDPIRRWDGPRRAVFVRPPRFVIASTDTLATDAATPAEGFTSRAQAAQALRNTIAADPSRAGLLQIVERAA
jgi:hypothetical protein